MAILYDLYITPTPDKEATGNPSYHARTMNRQTMDADVLIQHICERSTLGKGDVISLFTELNREVSRQLLAGNRVCIPGLGYFSLSLQTLKEVDPNSTRAQYIQVKRIEFRAEAALRDKVKKEATFERCQMKNHSASHSNEEILQLVIEYLQTHPFLTRETFSELCHFTRCTAINQLHRLVDEGILVNTNTPRNPIYMLTAERGRMQTNADKCGQTRP